MKNKLLRKLVSPFKKVFGYNDIWWEIRWMQTNIHYLQNRVSLLESELAELKKLHKHDSSECVPVARDSKGRFVSLKKQKSNS